MSLTIEQLSGGLAPEKDLVFPTKPDDPEMRESVSVWLFDDAGRFAFPRMGIEAETARWDDRLVQGNFAFADGRVLNGAGSGAAHAPLDADGRASVLGAGPISFRCVEPFRRWTMHWHGPARDGTVAQQIHGGLGTSGTVDVDLDVEMEMTVPAWVQDFTGDTAGLDEVARANAAAMGIGYRIEQHFVATGTFRIGSERHDFTGRGTRVHRQSRRAMFAFGHSWQGAVFPNGDAFAALAYPPREGSNGEYSHNDAMIYKDGRMVPARIVRSPFLRDIVPAGDPLTLELASEFGRTVITGETAFPTFRVGNPDIGGLNLQQSGALFRWDGQEAYGMVERSTHESQTVIG